MKRSPLHDRHLDHGARMVEFAGWEMPVQYDGIVAEHKAVRQTAGVFDISHMAEFEVVGRDAGKWLDGLLTNDISDLEDGRGQYTLMLNRAGGVIDDLIAYRIKSDRYFLVLNASREIADWDWLSGRVGGDVTLKNRSDEFGAIAVQGKGIPELWTRAGGSDDLPPRNGIAEHEDGELILCRTGYTGEDGFELFAPADKISGWFDRVVEAGAKPCGLGARDTLRLEKCYPLYGNDLDPIHTPLEAGLGFFAKLGKETPFVGQDILLRQKANGLPAKLAAIEMTGKAPPLRPHYPVLDAEGEAHLGELSSGSLSPTLGKGIGLAYLPVESAKIGTELAISIRDRPYPAVVVKKPFV